MGLCKHQVFAYFTRIEIFAQTHRSSAAKLRCEARSAKTEIRLVSVGWFPGEHVRSVRRPNAHHLPVSAAPDNFHHAERTLIF